MGPRLSSRGDALHSVLHAGQGVVAAMGPRLSSRGDTFRYARCQAPDRCNGATAFQPWRLGNRAVPAHDPCAAMGPRLSSRGDVTFRCARAVATVLQWGHGFPAVETLVWLATVTPFGPLQWGHGFPAVETPRRHRVLHVVQQGCNGATAFQPWRRPAYRLDVKANAGAAMGPRLSSRGDDVLWGATMLDSTLQWGHGFPSRGDGSLGSTLLSCGDGRRCERSPSGGL